MRLRTKKKNRMLLSNSFCVWKCGLRLSAMTRVAVTGPSFFLLKWGGSVSLYVCKSNACKHIAPKCFLPRKGNLTDDVCSMLVYCVSGHQGNVIFSPSAAP